MASAGYSLRQLAMPVLVAAAIVMVLTYACALYLAPLGQRALSAKVVDIRADIGRRAAQRRRIQYRRARA